MLRNAQGEPETSAGLVVGLLLAPGPGQTKAGRLWTYVRDDRPWGDQTPPAVWLTYTPDRKSEPSRAHLREFIGHVANGCLRGVRAYMAHMRRPFCELYDAHMSVVAKEALEQIAARMPSRKRFGDVPRGAAPGAKPANQN